MPRSSASPIQLEEELNQNENTEAQKHAIYLSLVQKLRIREVSLKVGLSKSKIMPIIRQFKCRKSLLARFYKAKFKPGWKIIDQHMEWIATWVENLGLRQFTLSQLREDFLLNFPNLVTIALSNLSNVLKKKVEMPLKKFDFWFQNKQLKLLLARQQLKQNNWVV